MSSPKLKFRSLLAVMLYRLQPMYTPIDDNIKTMLQNICRIVGIVPLKVYDNHVGLCAAAEQDFIHALSDAPPCAKLCGLLADLLHELEGPLFQGSLDDYGTARYVWAVRAALRMKPRDMKLYGGGVTGYLNHYTYTREQILRKLEAAL